MRGYKLLLLLICLFCVSCGKSDEQRVKEVYRKWDGKTILFPSASVFTIMGRDTVPSPPMDTDYKILSYVDSLGCTSCKLNLLLWDEWIHEMDSLAKGKVSFLFYMHPNDVRELRYALMFDDFHHPVCIDGDDALNKQNHFPSDSKYHTFLLDNKNRVVGIGDPIRYPAIKTLYMKKILNESP